MKITTLAIGALVASGITLSAFAHGGATGIVKERMDGMGIMGKSIKVLAPMMQGKVPLNPEAIRATAEEIRSHSGQTLLKLFPDGSHKKPSEAKAEIWDNWAEFEQMSEDLHLLSEGLSLAAGNPLMISDSTQNSASMMGSSSASMMGAATTALPDLKELAEMPVDTVFNMVTRTCAACHTKYRRETK